MKNTGITRCPEVWLITLLGLAAMQPGASAQTIWTAGTDATWSTPANWSSGEPNLTTAAIFPTPIPVGGSTITLSAGEQAQSLTFNADAYVLSGGTLELANPGNVTVTTATHTATINSVLSGTNGVTKLGAGTLTLGGANTYTDTTTVLNGTLTLASGGSIGVASATAGSLQIADRSTATLTVAAGGDLKVGNGPSDSFLVGSRTTDAGSVDTFGTLDMTGASSFTANVGNFFVGVATTSSISGTTRGIVNLAQNNTITASNEILVGQMTPALNNSNVVSQFNFGSGTNTITTPSFTLGSRKSSATSTIAAGGILNLANGVGGKTNLYLGRNNNSGTGTNASGMMDLTNGTFNATLGTVILGERSDSNGGGSSNGAGSGTGVLTLGTADNVVTADSLILGNLVVAGSSTVTQGTLNMAGGTFDVAGDVGLGIHTSSTAGALSRGTLNLTGGTFTVGGNITSSNKANSTAIITPDGGTLDLTGGSIDANTFNARSGTLKDVSQIFSGDGTTAANLTKTTTGTLTLSGTNTFTGNTIVSAGVLSITSTAALPGWDTNGRFAVADGATLAVANAVTDGQLATMLGTTNFAAGATIGFDTSIGNRTYSSVITSTTQGTLGLAKFGSNTLVLNQANTYTGATSVLGGTLTIASGGSIGVASATAGSLQVGDGASASLVVQAGGNLKVGSGSGDSLLVGARVPASGGSMTGTLNLSAAAAFTANVGLFQVGGSTSTIQSTALGTARGIVTLATDNTIAASTGLVVGRMTPSLDNTVVTSTLQFGSGTNDVTTPDFLIGGDRSKGTVTIASGGILNLDNGAGQTNLTIGQNRVASTNTSSVGTLNLTGGTFIADLDVLIIGDKGSANGGGAGTATGTLSLGTAANNVTANSVILGNQVDGAATSNNTTQGTLNMGGGTFTVAGDVGLGIYVNGGNSQGTLNLTGGNFTVNGNITSTNDVKSTAILNLAGGTLDLTGGSIDANTFTASSGTLQNVSQIFSGDGATAADLTKTGASPLILAGTNGYTGATIVSAGVLEVQGTTGTGATSVQDGATLAGAGTVQGVNGLSVALGGTLKPGNNSGNAIGTLAIASNLTLASNSTFSLQLAGTTPGTGYDQVSAGGEVSLDGSNFDLTLGFTPSMDDVFYVILNSGGPVNGRFAGLAEGATISANGASFRITYLANWTGTQAGSFTMGGNDVALIATVPEPGALTSLALGLGSLLGLSRFRRRRLSPPTLPL